MEQKNVAPCAINPEALRLASKSAIRGAIFICIGMPSGCWNVGTCSPGAILYFRTELTKGWIM
jgi:hypothetical protein